MNQTDREKGGPELQYTREDKQDTGGTHERNHRGQHKKKAAVIKPDKT